MKRLTPYLIFVLLTGGLVAFIYKDKIFPPEATDAAGGGASAQGGAARGGGGFRRGSQIVPVLADKVKTDNVPVYLNGVGTVSAYNTATVRTQVSGRLIAVPYTEGQDVKVGDVLECFKMEKTIAPELLNVADRARAQERAEATRT